MIDPFRPILVAAQAVKEAVNQICMAQSVNRPERDSVARDQLKELIRLIDRRRQLGFPPIRDGYQEGAVAWQIDTADAMSDLQASAKELVETAHRIPIRDWIDPNVRDMKRLQEFQTLHSQVVRDVRAVEDSLGKANVRLTELCGWIDHKAIAGAARQVNVRSQSPRPITIKSKDPTESLLETGAGPIVGADPAAHSSFTPITIRPYVFRQQETGVWLLQFGNDAKSFPNSEGMKRIHKLLCHPNKEMTNLALTGVDETKYSFAASPNPDMDAQYRNEVDLRIREVEDRAEEAVAFGNQAEQQKCQEELEKLKSEKNRGRNRTTGNRKNVGKSSEEKAKRAVSKAVQKVAIPSIRKVLPDLAKHLDECIDIETGRCIYTPTDSAIRWEL